MRDTLGILAGLLLAASVDPDIRRSVAGGLSASLPWTTFLPEDERAEFFDALTSTAAACVDVDTFEPLAHLVEGWRATAGIHANPDLATLLGTKHAGHR